VDGKRHLVGMGLGRLAPKPTPVAVTGLGRTGWHRCRSRSCYADVDFLPSSNRRLL